MDTIFRVITSNRKVEHSLARARSRQLQCNWCITPVYCYGPLATGCGSLAKTRIYSRAHRAFADYWKTISYPENLREEVEMEFDWIIRFISWGFELWDLWKWNSFGCRFISEVRYIYILIIKWALRHIFIPSSHNREKKEISRLKWNLMKKNSISLSISNFKRYNCRKPVTSLLKYLQLHNERTLYINQSSALASQRQ